MRMVIGGLGQGQIEYGASLAGIALAEAADGAICSLAEIEEKKMVYNLHLLIKRLLLEGEDPYRILSHINEQVIVTDEIGGGLVPIDGFERQWREVCGRICGEIAQKAQSVDRLYCGLAMRLKG